MCALKTPEQVDIFVVRKASLIWLLVAKLYVASSP